MKPKITLFTKVFLFMFLITAGFLVIGYILLRFILFPKMMLNLQSQYLKNEKLLMAERVSTIAKSIAREIEIAYIAKERGRISEQAFNDTIRTIVNEHIWVKEGLGKHGFAYLVRFIDNDSILVVVHPNRDWETKNIIEKAKGTPGLVKILKSLSFDDTVSRYYDAESKKAFLVSYPVGKGGLMVLLTVYMDEMGLGFGKLMQKFKQRREEADSFFLIMAIAALILSLFFAWILSFGIARPIVAYTKRVERMSKLEMDKLGPAPVYLKNDEIGLLSKAIRRLEEALRILIKNKK